jgi:hypothetical protein
MESFDRLLTVEDLADYLDVPLATIYGWRYHRQGPPGFPHREASPLPVERRRTLDRRPHHPNGSPLNSRM